MAIPMWTLIFLLIAIVLVFAGIRFGTDGPLIVTGTAAEGDTFERRYVENPWLAYLHIVPGVLYLLGRRCSCGVASVSGTSRFTAASSGCCSRSVS